MDLADEAEPDDPRAQPGGGPSSSTAERQGRWSRFGHDPSLCNENAKVKCRATQLPTAHRASARTTRRSTEELREPLAAALDRALLRRVVDVHEAEPAGVAPRPLEVVRERPDEVALERDPLVEGGRARHHVLLEVPATVLVLDLAVDHRVRIGRAVPVSYTHLRAHET